MQQLRYSRYFKGIFIFLDTLCILLTFLYFFPAGSSFFSYQEMEKNLFLLLVLILFWYLLSGHTKLYNVPRQTTYTLFLERLLWQILLFSAGIILLGKITNNALLEKDRIIISAHLFINLFIEKTIIFFALKYFRSRGFNHRNIMFLGEGDSIEILKRVLKERKDYGFKILDYNPQTFNLNNLKEFWQINGIHTLYIPSRGFLSATEEAALFRQAEIHKVNIALVPNISRNRLFEYDLAYIETQPILTKSKFPLDFFSNFLVKRLFDVVFSLFILLLICSWLFPIIILMIKMDSKGPVFFIQKRYGYQDEIFNCIKFRTMHPNRDENKKTTDENDCRITKCGRLLRKTSLDELPQFINVLKGDMSLVGPRPHMLVVDDFYRLKLRKYAIRSRVKPGITGLAQVNGLRGDNGNMEIEMQKRIMADYFYVKNWSFMTDLIIILKTVFLMFKGDKKAR